MFKIHALPVVYKVMVVKSMGQEVTDYDYVALPPLETIARFFAKDRSGYWFQIPLGPEQVCYDVNSNPFLKVRKDDKEDFHFGYSLLSEDKIHDSSKEKD